MNYKWEEPPNAASTVVRLIRPYFCGDGFNFSTFQIFHEPPLLHAGTVLSIDVPNTPLIRVMDSEVLEDIFEDIAVATCQLHSPSPNPIDLSDVEKLYPMFSAHIL